MYTSNGQYTFKVSLTREAYPKKPDKDSYNTIYFDRHDMTIDDFVSAIECGYGFTYVYNQQHFHIAYKKKENFRYTKVLAFDVDDTDCDMDCAIDACPYPPTIAYGTYSDGEDGKCSYRFIYIFEDYINSQNFKDIYHSVASVNHLKDLDVREINQFYLGTDKHNLYVSNIVYSLDVFGVTPTTYKTQSDLILSEDGTYFTFPEEYYEVRRLWRFDPETKRRYIERYTDSGKLSRRKQLFIDGQLIKKINNITSTDLMYAILKHELSLFYDNNTDTITEEQLMDIAKNVMKYPFTCKTYDKHPEFRLNVPYWKSVMNVGNDVYKPIVAINQVRKKIRMDIFKKLYNPSLTNKDNLRIMIDNGFKISERTLKRYKKDVAEQSSIL